jgi:hypothetical protein
MPVENFGPREPQSDNETPTRVPLTWGDGRPPRLDGAELDWKDLNRLIRSARKARDYTYGVPE